MKHILQSTLLAAALVLTGSAFAVDSFQVTGVVSEVSDAKITVLKGAAKERFEIARTADTKVTGDLKVGAKVTIAYTMTAVSIEAKGDAKPDKATDKKAAKGAAKSEAAKPDAAAPAAK
jgi:hypothetical protein